MQHQVPFLLIQKRVQKCCSWSFFHSVSWVLTYTYNNNLLYIGSILLLNNQCSGWHYVTMWCIKTYRTCLGIICSFSLCLLNHCVYTSTKKLSMHVYNIYLDEKLLHISTQTWIYWQGDKNLVHKGRVLSRAIVLQLEACCTTTYVHLASNHKNVGPLSGCSYSTV